MANKLMFEVGIKEADNQLTNLENRLKNIVSSYGKLELKVQVDGLKTFTSALESIGQGKGLEALQKRIDVLQVSLANVGMSGAKSIQEFEAAVKTTSAVAEQYTQRINQMTAARDKFAKGSTQWMALNSKLTDFQNDKQVVAIYAQEQVAIKNLEDAKVRLGNTNNQEAESFQKVISAIETLNNAANTLRVTLGTWDTNKGSVAQLIEQFEKLKNEVSAVAKELKTADVSKLNLSGLNLDLGKVAGIGDLNSAIRGLEVSINEIINLFSKLSNAVKLDSSSDVIRKLQADADAAQRTIQELTEKMNALAAAQNKVAGSTTTSGKTDAQVSASQEAMFNRYGKLLSDIQNIKREIVEIQRSSGGGGPFGDKLGEYFSSLNKIRNSVREITSAPSIADAIQRGMSSEKLAQLNSTLLLLKSNYKDIISDAKAFNKATDKGSSQAESRIRKLGMAFNELKNYMKANGGSEEMKRLQQEIQGAIRKMRDLMNAGNFAGAINVYERLSGIIRQAATATKEFEKGQQSLSSSVSHANSNLQHQSQILSDLKSMAMQYLSVWGVQNFINKIIETGGLLEQQRMSIGAILGDLSQANHLFGQIQQLALKSPFGVVQLDTMSKQLTAYNFKYSELYDWTKRLADISAATGTEVSRLSLALGHVRSEGALSGYTLRQFAMGNVPLLQTLAKQLGKTTSEIRKMTRAKEISYDDVEEALKSLTENGGIFENAQEVMSGALNAKFKNLRDAFDIMYGKIAEGGVGDVLKRVAEALTSMTKHWKETGAVIMTVAGYFGVQKIALLTMNKAMVEGNLISGQYTARQAELQAQTGALTKEMLLRAVASKNVAVADVEAAGAVYGLSRAQLQAVANTGKVSAAMNVASLATGKYTIRQMALMRLFNMTSWASFRKYLIGIRVGFEGLKVAATAAGAAIKGFFMNPATWWLVALTAGVEMFMRISQKADEAKERINDMQQTANEGFKALERESKNFKVGASVGMDTSQLQESIKDMEELLKSYSPQAGNTLSEAFRIDEKTGKSVHTLEERYEQLAKAVQDSKEAYKELGRISDIIEQSNEDTDGLTDESFRENTQDYIEALKERNKAETDFIANNRTKVLDALEKTRDAFRDFDSTVTAGNFLFEKTGGKEGFSSDDLKAQIDLLQSNAKYMDYFTRQMVQAGGDAASAWEEYNGAIGRAAAAQRTMDEDLQEFTSKTVKRLEVVFGKSVDQWSASQKLAVQKALEIFMTGIDGYSNMADSERKAIEEKLLKPFGIKIDVDAREANKEVTGLVSALNDLVGKDWVVKLKLDKATDMKSAIDILDKDYNEAKKTIARIGDKLKGQKMGKDGKYIIAESSVVIRPQKTEQSALATPWNPKVEVESDIKDEMDAKTRSAIEYNKAIDTVTKSLETYKELGIAAPEDKKANAQANKDAKDYAKGVREKIRVMKEAADAYQYWREKVGDKAAWSHVEDEFGSLLTKLKLDAKNIDKLKENIEGLTPEINAIKDNKVRTETLKEQQKELGQLVRKDFEKNTVKYVSILTNEIDELTRKWEIFNSVRNETGDSALAQRLTGITPGATPADLKRYNVASFAGVDIDFDSVLQMSDEQIDRYVEKLGVPEEKIEAIRNGLKDWKKAQKDIITSDIQNYAKWLGSLVDLQSIQTRNQNEYNQTLEETNRLLKDGMITQEEADRRKKSAAVTLDTKNWQTTKMYSDLYNNAIMMANSEFSQAYEYEMKSLNDQMKAGTLSAKDYADKVANLNEIAKEFSIDGFLGLKGGVGAFLSGGNDALIQYYNKRAKKARMAQAFYEQNKDKENAKKSEDEAKKYENLSVQLVKMSDGAKKVYSAFQTLGAGIDLVADLFANMGYGDTAEALGDVGSVFGSAMNGASSLSMLGPYGMAAGAAIGLVSGLFALHDKQLQRQIDALKENVEALKENTESIKEYRKRTLGYDDGMLRKTVSKLYKDTTTYSLLFSLLNGKPIYLEDPAKNAMKDYYLKNAGSSGYKAELENLKEQRDDFMRIYNLEYSKKNSSDEALREYKKQIAELDEQILYFVEDLASELWNINFKEWASQISDALWTAFENGESAMEAFHDTARDIISDVAKRMMNIHLIEPVFSKLEDRLFGKIGENGVRKGGVYNEETGRFNEEETLRILGQFFGEDGEFAKVVESAEDFYEMAERVTGFNLADDSSSSASRSIKGITEQTADLLASYISAIRLDVSVIRTMDAKVLQEYWPSQIRLMTAGSQSLANIENHTAAIMRSNDIVAEKITNLDSNITGLKNRTWSIPFS